jgi:protein O-GlcNAc transferase
MLLSICLGDHKQMFPHLKERLILSDKSVNLANGIADNVAVINATDLSPLEHGVKTVRVNAPVEIQLKVAELPTTTIIDSMIQSGLLQTSLNGVVVQNGLQANANNKAATGEEVPRTIVVTTRGQYGLPDSCVIYCNFNQLYKIDPLTLQSWVNILKAVPNSVLWLLRFPAVGEQNIQQTAQNLGELRHFDIFGVFTCIDCISVSEFGHIPQKLINFLSRLLEKVLHRVV